MRSISIGHEGKRESSTSGGGVSKLPRPSRRATPNDSPAPRKIITVPSSPANCSRNSAVSRAALSSRPSGIGANLAFR
jgi:hypothetical protein